ncbi:KamA family radical SAM protein [Paenibacillus xylanexedens]|uniref:KamA family radical SAM protein n=1 Tax=Paenibacillus xylanexedens TaxID=528191 RepID=UPI0009385329|nr:KamA family radical SAM protein [Paenibacillus xylanexedens]APO47201.1 KamA family radical SAM protein [Paenibacillus xylanexedens]
MKGPKYIRSINDINQLSTEIKQSLNPVTDKFVFRINEYYMNLIDWNDPNDPIRKIVIPSEDELQEYGRWDSSDEELNYVAPGCQHKYATTALLIVSEVCGAYCRYCFRKRLFRNDVKEAMLDVKHGIDYIRQHPEINNVLLTGGDAFSLSTSKLVRIIQELRTIEHVKIIRIGSKFPAFNPMRIYEDDVLLNALAQYSQMEKRIYVMCHFNHPRELTHEAKRCTDSLLKAGVVLVNQTPILKGINNDPSVLKDLLDQLSWAGITPYYFFVNRPVAGNKSFVCSLREVYELVEAAKRETSGLGKRVRLCMSHSSGKIEILAIKDKKAYLKYHQSRESRYGELMILECPDDASWFDDLPGSKDYWSQP